MATAKKAAAKKAADTKQEDRKSEASGRGLKVGDTWKIEASGRVLVTRPDGSAVVVASTGKTASHVVNQAGVYRAEAGDQVTTVEVG